MVLLSWHEGSSHSKREDIDFCFTTRLKLWNKVLLLPAGMKDDPRSYALCTCVKHSCLTFPFLMQSIVETWAFSCNLYQN